MIRHPQYIRLSTPMIANQLFSGPLLAIMPSCMARRPSCCGAHSGMFPCFFGGRTSRLLRSLRSASATVHARRRRIDHIGDVAVARREIGRGELGPIAAASSAALARRSGAAFSSLP